MVNSNIPPWFLFIFCEDLVHLLTNAVKDSGVDSSPHARVHACLPSCRAAVTSQWTFFNPAEAQPDFWWLYSEIKWNRRELTRWEQKEQEHWSQSCTMKLHGWLLLLLLADLLPTDWVTDSRQLQKHRGQKIEKRRRGGLNSCHHLRPVRETEREEGSGMTEDLKQSSGNEKSKYWGWQDSTQHCDYSHQFHSL